MVEQADLDNMQLHRRSETTEKDLDLSRYRSAWARIVAAD